MQKNFQKNNNEFKLEIFLWLFLLAIWFIPLGQRALFNTDEGRYATLALSTLTDGNWITPRLNGFLYFEKPILQYWGGAIIFYLFGVNDFTARLYPAIASFLTIITVSYTARKIFDKKEGQLSAIICAGTIWIIGNGHFLTLDMGLTLFLTSTLCCFILSQHENTNRNSAYYFTLLMWASMAFALLSKGLIGILIPGSTLILYSLINKQWAFWKTLQWKHGSIIFLLICAPWLALVSIKNHSFLYFFFIHEHFERFLTTEHHRAGPIWYFIPVLFVGALPWTSWLPNLFKNGMQDKTKNGLRIQRLLLIWSIFIFVFFSFSGSKLASYILPIFPAIALMLAHHINTSTAASMKKHLILPAAIGIIFLASYPVLSLITFTNNVYIYIKSAYPDILLIGTLMILAVVGAFYFLNKNKKSLACISLTIGSILSITIGSITLDTYITPIRSSRDIAPKILPYITNNTQIFSVDYYDQTLPFYLHRKVILVDYINEFKFGETQEPNLWIPDIQTFIVRWNKSKDVVVITKLSTYNKLKEKGLNMKILYKDNRRIVFKKS